MNDYTVELRDIRGSIIAQFSISGQNRGKAVHKAQLWYWEKYKGLLGPVHTLITVSDPAREVIYDEAFNCLDKKNRLLPPDVIQRVIAESNGELEQDLTEGTPHHAPGSVRRVKRRRDFGAFIAPNIRQMKNGGLYYRVVLSPQVSRRGTVLKKRKHKDIRLDARTLPEAIKEIRTRRLKAEHEKNTKRLVKARSLKFIEHVVGLRELTEDDKMFFARILPKYTVQKMAYASIPAT